MALQLRRGTDAERLQFTPLAGELIYTTDTKEVYIGDGSTVGGKAVTAFTESDAAAVVSSIFDANISVTQPLVAGQVLKYDGALWTNSSGILSIEDDSAPTLGGDLNLNGFNIKSGISTLVDSNTLSLNTSKITLNSFKIAVDNDVLEILHKTPGSSTAILHYMDSPIQHYQVEGITNGGSTCGVFTKTARGSLSSPTSVQPGDTLSFINLQQGYDGNNYTFSSGIAVQVDENNTVSTGAIPGKIVLITFSDNTTQHGITINSQGWMSINKLNSPVNATLDINGFAKLAILSDEPSTPSNGMVAIADGINWNPLSNGKQSMVVYLNGAWREIAASA